MFSVTCTLESTSTSLKPSPISTVSVLVSVEAIVTAPPLSVIVTLDPATKARVSLVANVLPPAVTVLGAVR